MDVLIQEEIKDNAKVLAEVELDANMDTLFDIYFDEARDFIFDYCKVTEIPTSLYSVMSKMMVYQYRQRGLENIQSEGKGSLSEAYLTEYPPNIMNRLSRHCQVKFL